MALLFETEYELTVHKATLRSVLSAFAPSESVDAVGVFLEQRIVREYGLLCMGHSYQRQK